MFFILKKENDFTESQATAALLQKACEVPRSAPTEKSIPFLEGSFHPLKTE